jgi:hypothetical protein
MVINSRNETMKTETNTSPLRLVRENNRAFSDAEILISSVMAEIETTYPGAPTTITAWVRERCFRPRNIFLRRPSPEWLNGVGDWISCTADSVDCRIMGLDSDNTEAWRGESLSEDQESVTSSICSRKGPVDENATQPLLVA